LAFASLTQVGLIVAEIGLGFRYLALVHILGHASLRTLQFLRASSLLQDYLGLENAIGSRLPSELPVAARLAPSGVSPWLYRLALERGYLDAWLSDYIARPVLTVLRACDKWERQASEVVSGRQTTTAHPLAPIAGSLEESL
jgi:NADH-quinone oxidoreductase subunit L